MKKKQILIVEDEAIIALNIRNLLENLGFSVPGIASSAEEAVKLADEYRPDLIIIDIILDGEIDGIEAVKEIKLSHKIPIIYMTAHSDENTLARAKATEPHGYILKPVNFNELRSTIEIVLHKHKMEEKLIEEKNFTDAALNAQMDTFFVFDPETGKPLRWNREFRRVSGYTDDEIAHSNAPADFYSENDLKRAEEALSKIVDNGNITIQLELMAKDGRKIPFEYNATLIKDKEGKPRYICSVGRDITERLKTEEEMINKNNDLESANEELHAALEELEATNEELINTQDNLVESEKKYQSIFMMMIDGYALHEIILDKNGKPADYRFLEINPAFEKLTGLTKDIIGKTVREVIPGIEDFWIETYGEVALTGKTTRIENYAEPLKKWFEISAYSPIRGRFVAIFADITYRKNLVK